MLPRFTSRIAALAAITLILVLVAWAYWPGLTGPFLFDDYGNLDVLGAYGRIDDWPSFLYYVTSGTADPTGRPIALLTFLLDANAWPAAPWPFKRTNLALHLINTGLLAWVIAQLQSALQRRDPQGAYSPWTPLLAAILWGAHPFFVSTTLYVVQREAMLPMVFVLLALMTWERAVLAFGHRRDRAGWTWAIVGMGGATLLAGFSKANGFLTPLLVGLAYLWFLRPRMPFSPGRLPAMDRAALLCLAVPSLLVLTYLVHLGWQLWSVPQLQGRDWTLPERLLSEPRALWSYVLRMALPRAGGGGVFVDDFATSHGWLDPLTTLPALAALMASVIAAIASRRRYPVISFAWLFFLAAHLLESTTIPLELYFEHRNYLPAVFLGWPIAHAVLRPGNYRRSRAVLAAVIVCGLLLLTRQRAEIWGNEALLTALSAEHQVNSARSQIVAAREEVDRGKVHDALVRIHALQRRYPESVDIAVNSIGFECQGTGALTRDTLSRAQHALRTASGWNYGIYTWMQRATRDAGLLRCRGFGLPGLTALVTSAETNPQSAASSRRRDLWHVRGRIALAQNQPEIALQWFDAALSLQPDPEYALVQAAALGDAGFQELGVQHLDRYARIEAATPLEKVRDMAAAHAWLLRHYGYYRDELSSLRQRLEADANKATNVTTPPG